MNISGPIRNMSGLNGAKAYEPGSAERVPNAPNPQAIGRQDKVRISDQAREASKIMNEVRLAPDVREEKVRAMKEAIASGQYQVSGEAVAGKLIRESILGSIL